MYKALEELTKEAEGLAMLLPFLPPIRNPGKADGHPRKCLLRLILRLRAIFLARNDLSSLFSEQRIKLLEGSSTKEARYVLAVLMHLKGEEIREGALLKAVVAKHDYAAIDPFMLLGTEELSAEAVSYVLKVQLKHLKEENSIELVLQGAKILGYRLNHSTFSSRFNAYCEKVEKQISCGA